jgi:ribulose-5-phosphate 4-epimerase/fuculose-1-phosphate aldolase
MNERELREAIAVQGASLFDRGLTHGRTGNISVRLPDGILVTPTGCCLGRLDPDRVSKLNRNGDLKAGDTPSKEVVLHQAVYASRPDVSAIVHLHSTYSVAVSCLANVNENDVFPPLTAYYVMRVGKLPLIPYFPPGDEELANAVGRMAKSARAMLLANHGPVLAAGDLDSAVDGIEELEQTALLHLLLRGQQTKPLSPEQCQALQERFPT